jgi:hypothetical protein
MRTPNEAMDLLGQEQLQMLLEYQDNICISIYLPSQHMGAEIKVVPLRLAQLLDGVETQLVAQGNRLPDVQNLLKPARSLPVGARAPFWQHQQEGLAIFLSKSIFVHYRLPIAFAEQVTIGHRFAIRALIPLLSGDGIFYLLALSENQVRFFRGTRFTIEELSLGHAPLSLSETLRYDEFEKELQQHTTASSGLGGGRASMFHGHGDAGDAAIQHKHLLRFLQEVDAEVCNLLREERAPLVLAGVDAVRGLYQTASHYPAIAETGITGSPDRLSAKHLHQRAWTIVAPHFQRPKELALEQFCRLYPSGDQHTLHDWMHLIQAAYYQQVETLFIPIGAQVWGTFDQNSATASLHPRAESGDEDLVDAAAAYTLRNGGTVYQLAKTEMPYGLPVAAILRT